MIQDIPEISGGENVGIRWRGKTFSLWTGCAEENAAMGAGERLDQAFAEKVGAAARTAALAAGIPEQDVARRPVIELYPFCRNPELREQSRAGIREYCRIAPDPNTMYHWRRMLALWEAERLQQTRRGEETAPAPAAAPRRARKPSAKQKRVASAAARAVKSVVENQMKGAIDRAVVKGVKRGKGSQTGMSAPPVKTAEGGHGEVADGE